MAEYVQNGDTIEYTNPGTTATIKHGDVVELPARIGVAVADIAPGETGSVSITEAFSFPTAAEAIPIGTLVYWDKTAKAITKTDTGNIRAGIAISAKTGAAAGTITVRLE